MSVDNFCILSSRLVQRDLKKNKRVSNHTHSSFQIGKLKRDSNIRKTDAMRRAPLDPDAISQVGAAQSSAFSCPRFSSSPIIVSLRKVGGHLFIYTRPDRVSGQVTTRPFSFLRLQSEFSLSFFLLFMHPFLIVTESEILLRPVDHLRGAQNEYLVYDAAFFR